LAAGRGRAGLDGPPLARPFLEPAVQDRGIVEAVVAQHPPDAGRPLRRRRAVEDDAAFLADPEATHRGSEFLGIRQHEAQFRVRRREVGLQIDELRTGDVALLEILAPGLDDVGDLRVRDQMDRAIEHDQVRLVEVSSEPVRLDQEFGVGKPVRLAHARLPMG
jgi:hypothetical protein